MYSCADFQNDKSLSRYIFWCLMEKKRKPHSFRAIIYLLSTISIFISGRASSFWCHRTLSWSISICGNGERQKGEDADVALPIASIQMYRCNETGARQMLSSLPLMRVKEIHSSFIHSFVQMGVTEAPTLHKYKL